MIVPGCGVWNSRSKGSVNLVKIVTVVGTVIIVVAVIVVVVVVGGL